MRYLAAIFILIFSLSFFLGCGKSPEDGVNYNEKKLEPPPEKQEPGEGVKQVPQ